ncbi:E3 binding domain-containing protein [Acuticoccus sp. M5D2P5]|uniref:biotin/lipoyl-containing protein n=1 Tax=Acuticoccus kalidii TaxID=2910977 RepID=UPI001F3FE195|nr:biotin/lipoyl-containing protein [Acuticoccus kalidii]MCF3932927.1 E3 binding domain-containing protein [Acuticoccus kalidii]
MAHDVLMPQLGMAQDAGLIVAWHKGPGDPVAADDVLMEVETDKATMEVPAGRDGVLATIRAAAGEEVPVGNVIAVIAADAAEAERVAGEVAAASANDGDAPVEAGATSASPAPAAVDAIAVARTEGATAEAPRPTGASPSGNGTADIAAPAADKGAGPTGRILATPKARRLAEARGIDLAALVGSGAREPILYRAVADAPDPGEASIAAPVATPIAASSALEALAERSAFDALLAEADPAPTRAAALAAFLAGAWRGSRGADSLRIAVQTLGAPPLRLTDPDRVPLSRLGGDDAAAGDGAPDISLFDLTESRLASYRPAASGTSLTLLGDGTAFRLLLAFDERTLPLSEAAHLLDELARRIEDPIRQLL